MTNDHVLVNPEAATKQGSKRWRQIENFFTQHQIHFVEDQEFLIENLKDDDRIICAGGDGTIHTFVNNLVKEVGLENLRHYIIGYLALGSNNSFIQPVLNHQKYGPFFGRASQQWEWRDIIEVQIRHQDQCQTRYLLSNGSLGFLASANQIYNKDYLNQFLKKRSPTTAEVWTFLKTLKDFNAIPLKLSSPSFQWEGPVSNLNILKSPYFTRDLFYPGTIDPQSGLFQCLLLKKQSSLDLLSRFGRAFILEEMQSLYTTAWKDKEIQIESDMILPVELDGEVYWGKSFAFRCLSQKMRICK